MEQINTIKYKPLIFVVFTFLLTWICAFLMAFVNYKILLYVLDFIESASPLIVSIVLLKNYFTKKKLFYYFFGKYHGMLNYILVVIIFILQFLNFYLFRIDNVTIRISTFITILLGQIFLGGGLEEAGWRGYLQPAFERKISIVLTVLLVGLIWVVWHLPYFLLPNNMHTGSNFLVYAFIGIITAFILTAIYKLTGSILLCTLFHGWQNTIVMTIPANQGHIGFMVFFIGLGIASIIICFAYNKKEKKWYVA